jgi:lipopolysaccharide transport system ATP-binding protein
MSSKNVVVAASGLGKQYVLGRRMPAFRTLRDAVAERFTQREKTTRELMWALRDVAFEIEAGEAVGVIGVNGAGKTTLLKILSRITAPTEGEIMVKGRVGSLLEVGTGFHPELTGRENVFLNGAILGMGRAEIARKLDDIVTFAGVERFVDTPVKRFSSGMYVRLAFSVAAHLDTDILLVDEVLSVGDFGFQRRSLRRMEEQTQSEGRTVLFVSHNLGAVRTLTSRCIWLEHGQVREIGPTTEILGRYIGSQSEAAGGGVTDLSDLSKGRPTGKRLEQVLSFESVALERLDGQPSETHLSGVPVRIVTRIRAHEPMRDRSLDVRCRLVTVEGVLLFSATSSPRPLDIDQGIYETSFTIDPNPLAAGIYNVELYIVTMGDNVVDQGQDLIPQAITLRIEENPSTELYLNDRRGLINVSFDWTPLEPVRSALEVGAES